MIRAGTAATLALVLIIASGLGAIDAGMAQTTTDQAKADGKAFAGSIASRAQEAATTTPDPSRIPNYDADPIESAYGDDPDSLTSRAASAAPAHTGYRVIRVSMESRSTFDSADIEAVLARSTTISGDPLSYTSGMSVTGSQGSCVPLPGGTASPGRYYATCNAGYTASEDLLTCPIALEARIEQQTRYQYYCVEGSGIDPTSPYYCGNFPADTCTVTQSIPICGYWSGYYWGCYCTLRVDVLSCSETVPPLEPYATSFEDVLVTTRNESACTGLDADDTCAPEVETCTDSDPVTRIIDGQSVTKPCWAWERSYTCNSYSAAEDCGTLETTPGCTLVREDCLAGEPCRTWERVYDCPLPDEETATTQYICDGDVYCIDGSCETIERTPNDEFKDAVVALNAMDQARREFDPDTLRLFEGTRNTCSSKVFGVLNCCKGKGFPLLPGSQLLVSLGCSRAEVLLHERDSQGLCAYVGTYCSDSFLGVCLTKKKVYCCFESKLSRILQEQGRVQLNKPWDKPKDEQCRGFTIDEFARLDLSRMDFSEVYAEFTAAARLPDELEAASDIQQKIEDYYARSGS
ncbi:hypothetical protein GCM10010990_28260 [Croceicoccus mobilis]|uniref:Conjugal transfer protein TraN n=2 Tax=Croceicoccus mobilis TaxID=1703339 RepID=A0A916Z5N0_9SPHN|nr:conjugal transfer protein TraN [Croceicoccus mobilis]GGD76901.1 hypothetical protein GCM10010990_28260 [Croceicoccus mobilis]